MMSYQAPVKDMLFILSNLVGLDEISTLPSCQEATAELTESILNAAATFASEVISPINHVGDVEGCSLEGQNVRTPSGWKAAYNAFIKNGWVGLSMPVEYGGQGLAKVIAAPVNEIWFGANMAFSLLAPMALGFTETLVHSASETLKRKYLPNLANGIWTATMDLTEPNAGSDLSAIQTRATRHDDESYRIFGQKIYITYGEHDLAQNILHLVLARLPDAPPGVRGISMFLVPKHLTDEKGIPIALNDMRCISIEKKLGIHGSPTCTMSYGEQEGAVGYLVGEPNRGLEYMFVMVNDSRFNVGLQGIGVAQMAYLRAIDFAKQRHQGRDAVTGEHNVPIIKHPDVRRMLLSMRSQIMAARILAYVAAGWMDRAKHHSDAVIASRSDALVNLLMPVIKSCNCEMGFEVANMGIQIHGGMGFIEETGVAQYLRDIRIATIYEGTTGIQASDLVSRKILRDRGVGLGILIEEMENAACQARQYKNTAALGERLDVSIKQLSDVAHWIESTAGQSIGNVLAVSVHILRFLGTVCGAWQMTRAAIAASAPTTDMSQDKEYLKNISTLAFFYFDHHLPFADAHLNAMLAGGDNIVDTPDSIF